MRLYAPSRAPTTSSSVAAGPGDGAARTRPATTRARALRMGPLYTRVRGRARPRDPGARLRRRALRRDARVRRVRLARLSAAPAERAARAAEGPPRAVRPSPAARGKRLGDAGADPRTPRGGLSGLARTRLAPRRVARRSGRHARSGRSRARRRARRVDRAGRGRLAREPRLLPGR